MIRRGPCIGIHWSNRIFGNFSMISGEYYDPRETSLSILSTLILETNTVLNLSSGCWLANVEGDDSDYDVTFQYVEGGAAAGDVSEDCRSDFRALQ